MGSGGCDQTCGPDDRCRVRAYETTYSIPRFNNGAGTRTVVIVQNPTDRTVRGQVYFWSALGGIPSPQPFTLAPRSVHLFDPPEGSGSATVANDAPYGALAGKAVSFDVSNGLTFDTPMLPKPREAHGEDCQRAPEGVQA